MFRTSRLGMLGFALLVAAGMLMAATEKKASLDGKSFAVQLIRSGSKTGDSDTLSFVNGKFDSMVYHKYGFTQSEYKAKNEGKSTTFEVHAVATDQSQEVWTGTVEGNEIRGTMRRTDPMGSVTYYQFRGESKSS